MNLTAADIDRIVAEVVRRLRALAATSSTTSVSEKRETTSHLNLTEKVITLQTLKGKLDGITTVIVSERAIVTPAVKDELRDRKIRWEREGRGRESLAKNDLPSSQETFRQRLPTPDHLKARS